MDKISVVNISREIQEKSFWALVFFLFAGIGATGPSLKPLAIIYISLLIIYLCSNIVLTVTTCILENKILLMMLYMVCVFLFIFWLSYGIYYGVVGNIWGIIIFGPVVMAKIFSLIIYCPYIQNY